MGGALYLFLFFLFKKAGDDFLLLFFNGVQGDSVFRRRVAGSAQPHNIAPVYISLIDRAALTKGYDTVIL